MIVGKKNLLEGIFNLNTVLFGRNNLNTNTTSDHKTQWTSLCERRTTARRICNENDD